MYILAMIETLFAVLVVAGLCWGVVLQAGNR